MRLHRPLTVLLTAAALGAGASEAAAHPFGAQLPDAEIFATNNTAVITDPDDPRLDKQLRGFERRATELIWRGGGVPRGSQLLDGVFWSEDLQSATLERSRDFDVDHVSVRELGDIAESIRVRFGQQSVLTFDYPEGGSGPIDAVEVTVPGIDAVSFRDALVADEQAQTTLFGGSVTQDGALVLIVGLADAPVAKAFVERLGGDWDAAAKRFGHRAFVG